MMRYSLQLIRAQIYWRRAGVVFIHVPRVAGSSVNHLLYGKTLGHFRASHALKLIKYQDIDLPSFSLVRNPYDRLISAYNFAKLGNTSVMGISNPEFYKTRSFRSFDSFLNEWLSEQNLAVVDEVFRPQTYFLNATMSHFPSKVFMLNQMNELSLYLSDLLGVDISLPSINSSSHYSDQSYASLSECSKRTIEQLYRSDFDFIKKLK